jgi:thymidylate kinase
MRILVTSRSGAGKSTLAAELQKRGMRAFDGDKVPGLAFWQSTTTGENLGKVFPDDYSPDAYDWMWDEHILTDLLSSASDTILFGSADNASDFYNLFDLRYILSIEPREQIKRMTQRGDEGYGGGDRLIHARVLREQQRLVESASEIGAILLNANPAYEQVADNLIESINEHRSMA